MSTRRPAARCCILQQGVDSGMDRCFPIEVATLRATCSLHAGFMLIAFSKCISYFSKCSLHVARITLVCSLHTPVCRKHQCRSNLISWTRINVDRRFDPSSSHDRLHNVKLRSADVVQLNHDFELWLYVLEADWSDLMEISGVTRIVVCPVQYIAWDRI